NYGERMASLQERFERDFRDALARIWAVRDGLKKVYGYDRPLPKNVELLRDGEGEACPGCFDECLMWVRDAIGWLVRFTHAEQEYALPVSLAVLLTRDEWAQGITAGRFSFNIKPEMFDGQGYVRLRGINLFVEPKTSRRQLWRATIAPPRDGLHLH